MSKEKWEKTPAPYLLMSHHIDQAVEDLLALAKLNDEEVQHHKADDILLRLVPREVRSAYDKIPKWYA